MAFSLSGQTCTVNSCLKNALNPKGAKRLTRTNFRLLSTHSLQIIISSAAEGTAHGAVGWQSGGAAGQHHSRR